MSSLLMSPLLMSFWAMSLLATPLWAAATLASESLPAPAWPGLPVFAFLAAFLAAAPAWVALLAPIWPPAITGVPVSVVSSLDGEGLLTACAARARAAI